MTAMLTTDTKPIEAPLLATQVRLLFQNLGMGVKLATVAMLLIFIAIRTLGPVPTSVRWWGGITLGWVGIGYVLNHVFHRQQHSDAELGKWGRQASVGSGIAGVAWGSVGFCALDPAAHHLEPLFIAVACLMSVGVYAGYACYLPAMYGFVGGITVTYLISLLWQGDAQHLCIATMLVLTAAFALYSGRNFNRLLNNEIIMRARNAELVEVLTQKQAEVESATLAKSRFLAAASHDLRQPVHAINLYGEVLRGHVQTDDGQRVVHNMTRSIQALDGLFESIEDIAKFEAGIVTAKISTFALEHVLSALRADHSQAARAKGLQLNIPTVSAMVTSDVALLQRILGNLVSNAIRYTDTGSITVEVQMAEERARVTVRDTGIGIPQDRLDDIFREFVQLHNPERDRGAGLGLGLNIVKRLADMLKHPLEVTSTMGRGSSFALTLPAVVNMAASVEYPSDIQPVAQGLEGSFIAVIDDDADILQSTALLLSSWGCYVLTAESGDEALRRVEDEQRFPDLILSDYRLRGEETGVASIRSIRKLLGQDIPAVIISGDTDPICIKEAFEAGMPLLHKPVPAAKLREAVVRAMGSAMGSASKRVPPATDNQA